MLHRDDWRRNQKRVHRIYKEEGLSLRHCRLWRSRSVPSVAGQSDHCSRHALGQNSVGDALYDGRRFRLLTVLGLFSHECLDIVVDQLLCGEHATGAIARLVTQHGRLAVIKVDSGSKFAGKGGVGLRRTVWNWTFATRYVDR